MKDTTTTGLQFDLPKGTSSIIKVIGVGGGGNNALRHMYEKGIHGVDFVICNTDAQTLDNNPISNKVQLGATTTEGLGAGADPEVGEKAAIESIDEIRTALGQNTKMVFITAGMGGGTGTGAAPVIAKAAKEMGILTVGIVTVPFTFEGKRRLNQAETGLQKLRDNVDSLIVINNDKLRELFGNLGFRSGFAKADEVLTNAAKGMAEVITGYFDVNIDFRDAKSVLQNSGTALMSTGIASGENKAEEAVKKALDSPLLNDNKITGAKNVLLLIRSGNEEVTMGEIGVIMEHIQQEAGNTADIIFGVGTDEELGEAVSVLVIATGFSKDFQKQTGHAERTVIELTDGEEESISSTGFVHGEKRGHNPERNLFRLDDEQDEPQPTFQKKKPLIRDIYQGEVREPMTNEEDYEGFRIKEKPATGSVKKEGKTLFTFDEETEEFKRFEPESMEPEEPVSFSFILEEEKEAPEEISVPEFKTETQPAEEPEEEVELTSFEREPETPQIRIIDKTESSRVQERRDKLREFNTRFQKETSEENIFEKIPAFRRKNIQIEEDSASNKTIGTYLAEDEEGLKLRKNRFLNKDVD